MVEEAIYLAEHKIVFIQHRGAETAEDRLFFFAVERPAKKNLASASMHCGRRPQGLWRIGLTPILQNSDSSQRSKHLDRVHVFHERVGGEMG